MYGLFFRSRMPLRIRTLCAILTVLILIYSKSTFARPDISMYPPHTGGTQAPFVVKIKPASLVRPPLGVFDTESFLATDEQGFLDFTHPGDRSAGLLSLVNFEAIPFAVGGVVTALLGGNISAGILKLVGASSSSSSEGVKRMIKS